MIIVLLLFFQSICLYCQRIVLQVHDRWINPKNVRLLKEAAETTSQAGYATQKLQPQPDKGKRATRKRYTTASTTTNAGSLLAADACRFCANTPQGYCRHHFHLQEVQLQRQQQGRSWNPLADRANEQRQLRKISREIKRNLKNRLNVFQLAATTTPHQPTQQRQQPHLYHQTYQQNPAPENDHRDSGYGTVSSALSLFVDDSQHSSLACSIPSLEGSPQQSLVQSPTTTTDSGHSSSSATEDTTYFFEPTHRQLQSESQSSILSSATTIYSTSTSTTSFSIQSLHSALSTSYL